MPPYDATFTANLRADRERYDADRRKDMRLSATNGLDAAIHANRLDALLFPSVNGADIAARIDVPSGL